MSARIFSSPYPSLGVSTNLSISQFLLSTNPDDTPTDSIILCDFANPDSYVTYGGIRQAAAVGAGGLKNVLGLTEEQTVCIFGGNSVNWALLAHSAMWAGACLSAINPLATAYELVHYFGISKPHIIAAEVKHLDTIRAALKLSPGLQPAPMILLLDDGNVLRNEHIPLFPRDIINPSHVAIPPFDLSKRDNRTIPAALIFSSGTSGKPKGVMLSHYNLIAQLLTLRATSPFSNNGAMREVFFPPFSHIYGLVAAVLLSAYVGAYIVAMPTFTLEAYLSRCAEIRATALKLVPATAVRMTKDPTLSNLDLSSVRFISCSGAALAPAVAKSLQQKLPGAVVTNGFGMSEATVTLLRETQAAKRPGCVGRPAAGVELRVVDEELRDVAPGQPGECLIRAPTVFMGYKGDEEATKAAFVKDETETDPRAKGWLRSGDVVRVDEDGFVWLVGRLKELIKYQGNQVPPAELESVLLQHPLVADAGVCGLWDEKRQTELPAGYVCLAQSILVEGEKEKEKALEDIKRFVHERVAPYKKLRGGLFCLEQLPKNKSGKLMRKQLPEQLKEEKKWKQQLGKARL